MRAVLVRLVVAGACAGPGSAGAARPDGIFDLPGERTAEVKGWVTVGNELPASVRPGQASSPMLLLLDGVLAELSPHDLALLDATPEPGGRLIDARGELARVGVVQLVGKRGEASVEILMRPDGSLIAREVARDGRRLEEGQQRIVRLNHRRFEEATTDWLLYEGFGRAGDAAPATGAERSPQPGQVAEMAKPYTPGRYIMDGATLGDRFQHGHKSNLAAKRTLSDTRLYVRLPRGYDPKRPAGLLVWINADNGGEPPEVFHAVADELNIICVGAANSGNLRELADRFQLAFDGIATVSRRWHVDGRRVYITGISGGGRTSGRLAICFPDIFAGAVPIVGLDVYQAVPLGNSHYSRPGCEKPLGKLWTVLRSRRIAPITGPEDANYGEIKGAVEIMSKDGLRARVFEYADMGHQMPTAERFAEALKWVDEPYREQQKKDAEQAAGMLGVYVSRFGEVAPADDKQRAALVKVTEVAPWTEPAWKAAELLRRGKGGP